MSDRVLVVEDEPRIRALVRTYLERAGLAVTATASGAEAVAVARDGVADLVVLDLRLPDLPGEEVARSIRQFSAVPILMLTAKSAEEDRIRGLELGADDYVTKPFSPRELVLRVQAILRRVHGDAGQPCASYGEGELVIDEDCHRVIVRGAPVELTPTESALVMTLARVPGRVYSRYELATRLRGDSFDGDERTVDSHVKNLRRKIELDPHAPRLVETVLGSGYRLGLRRDR